MGNTNKDELYFKLGQETIYSAKGHFKSSDIRRNFITGTIWLCMLLNIIALIGIDPHFDRWLSAGALFGTIALLIWNEGEGKDYRYRHRRAGESYLALHKEIRELYLLGPKGKSQLQELSAKVRELDQNDCPPISLIARRWAQYAIEKGDETDNWFTNEHQP